MPSRTSDARPYGVCLCAHFIHKEECHILHTLILLAILALLLVVMSAPVRLGWKLGLNALCGFGCLIVLNLLGSRFGLLLDLNVLTCAVAAVLGLPGLGALLILHCLLA